MLIAKRSKIHLRSRLGMDGGELSGCLPYSGNSRTPALAAAPSRDARKDPKRKPDRSGAHTNILKEKENRSHQSLAGLRGAYHGARPVPQHPAPDYLRKRVAANHPQTRKPSAEKSPFLKCSAAPARRDGKKDALPRPLRLEVPHSWRARTFAGQNPD